MLATVCVLTSVCVSVSVYGSERDILDIGVGADDVLDLIGVGVLEGEAAGPDQHPLTVLHTEPVHDRQNLPLQLHHLEGGREGGRERGREEIISEA